MRMRSIFTIGLALFVPPLPSAACSEKPTVPPQVRILLEQPAKGLTFNAQQPFFRALADLAKAQGRDPTDYTEWKIDRGWCKLNVGRAERLTADGCDYMILVLDHSIPSIPGTALQYLVLLGQNGTILDKIACHMNSRYGRLETSIKKKPESDGARIVIDFIPGGMNSGRWHNWHRITYRGQTTEFTEDMRHPQSIWDEKGLCRMSVDRGRFKVLFPELPQDEPPRAGEQDPIR